MKNKIQKVVITAVNELNDLLDNKLLIDREDDCELYGQSGMLDSISLVTLIVKIEEKIEKEFDASIILANEKAMSQKRSPFLTVGSLSTYIESLIFAEVCHA
jgi:acyl carrier protein